MKDEGVVVLYCFGGVVVVVERDAKEGEIVREGRRSRDRER